MRLHVILHFFVVTPKSDPFRPFDKTSFLQTFFFRAQRVDQHHRSRAWPGRLERTRRVSLEGRVKKSYGCFARAQTRLACKNRCLRALHFDYTNGVWVGCCFFLCYIPWSSCRATASCWRLEMLDGDVFFVEHLK